MSLAERMRKSYNEKQTSEQEKRDAVKRLREARLDTAVADYIQACKEAAEKAITEGRASFHMPCYVTIDNDKLYFSCSPIGDIKFKNQIQSWAVSEGLVCNILENVERPDLDKSEKVRFYCL